MAAFTGANGEITVNIETHNVVVHDGVTAGGWVQVSNSSLVANLANYPNTTNLSANVSALQSQITSNSDTAYTNAVSYTDGKILTANSAITGNAATAYTNAVSYTDGKILTSNAAITGNAATAYTNAVSYTDTKIGTANLAIANAYTNAVSYTDGKILTSNAAITGNAATAYTNAVAYADTKNSAITGNAATAYTNATIFAANASNINTGTLAEARLPYRMDQNIRTTDNITLGSLTLTGNLYVGSNVNVIGSNNLSLVDNMIYLNANNTITNPDLGFAGNYNDGVYRHAGFFRDASDAGTWKVFDSYLPEPDANSYIDTANTSFKLANFQANTLNAGNTSINWFIANTLGSYVTGTVNAASHTVGTTTIANSIGVYTGVVNATTVSTGSVNVVNTSGLITTANVNIGATGELILTAGAGIYANGGLGSAGEILHSNGSSVYWGVDDQGVTSVATGNGLTGGTITTTGTVSVLANNGITANSVGLFVTQGTGAVVNATGVHVNSTYIGTLSANNTTYVNGKTEGNLNVNSATYATSAGSATNASAATNATYATSAGSAGSATNATYATSAGSATNATTATNFSSTSQNSQFNSIGIGTPGSGTAGEIRATNNITAYYSDMRLKTNINTIIDALDKIKKISGVTYINNDIAARYGYTDQSQQVGVLAQEIEKVLPMAVKLAPFDSEYIDGAELSKSGENYKTVQYEKIIPLLIEAIKELSDKLDNLQNR